MYFACIKTESSMLHFADNRNLNTKTQQRTTITAILCCQKCIINVNNGLSISPLAGYDCLSNSAPGATLFGKFPEGRPPSPPSRKQLIGA